MVKFKIGRFSDPALAPNEGYSIWRIEVTYIQAIKLSFILQESVSCTMFRLHAFILLIIYLSANTEMHQLYRLPALIDHVLQHRALDSERSIASILLEHYNSEASHDSEHHDLPFSGHDCKELGTNTFFLSLFDIELNVNPEIQTTPVAFYTQVAGNHHSFSIWQPPKA